MQKHTDAILIFFIFILIYLLGSFTKIPFGDCMAFILDTEKEAYIKPVSPTTHFLYINTAIFIKKATSLDAILVNRLLIIISAAFVVFMVYNTVQLITRKSWISIVASFVFGFSFTFWKNAEIIEVYTYNMVWVALFLYFLIKTFLRENNKTHNIIFTGLFLSVSLWTHIENIFFIPSFLIFLYYFKKDKSSVVTAIFLLVLSFSLMLLLNSLENLPPQTIFTSPQGNWVSNSFKKSTSEYFIDLLKSFIYLLYNFNLFVIFGVIGAFKLFKRNKKLFYVIAISATLFYGFSTFYAVSDNYVFFLPFNYIFAIGIGIGVQNFGVQKYIKKLSPICLLIPLLYFFSFNLLITIPQIAEFQQSKSYKGGLSYYVLPWMNNNVGILEFTIEQRKATDHVNWMIFSANEYIKHKISKGYTLEEIKKF